MNQDNPIRPDDLPEHGTVPETNAQDAPDDRYVTDPPHKPARQVPLAAAIASVAAVCVIAVLLTFSLTVRYMDRSPDETVSVGSGLTEESPFSEIELIDRLFRSLTIKEPDDDALLDGVLKGYVSATGDRYAEYFNAEELAAQQADQNGELCGIGITVTMDTVAYNGVQNTVATVLDVYEDSPALAAGLLPGDMIYKVGKGAEAASVTDIGYEEAINRIRGEEGTEVTVTVLRKVSGTEEPTVYEQVTVTAVRKKLTVKTVKYRVSAADASVGIVTVSRFNNTTAPQFAEAVDALTARGCTSFVLDLRSNPGGLLTAVEDLVTYFLSPDDVILYSRNNAGEKTTYQVKVDGEKVTSGSGTLKASDVGRFKGMKMAVLVNGDTASAAELFTANVMYYKLGTVVGVNTYGKGTMQTTYSLSQYGYSGALKLTTQYYDGPSGENYDGKGLVPDTVVELTEEAASYALSLLPEDKDNQLAAALAALGK